MSIPPLFLPNFQDLQAGVIISVCQVEAWNSLAGVRIDFRSYSTSHFITARSKVGFWPCQVGVILSLQEFTQLPGGAYFASEQNAYTPC